MDRVLKINYWIGIVVAVALLLESGFGIYSFIHSKQQAQSFQNNFSQNRPNFNGGGGSSNPSNGSNGAPQFGGGSGAQGQRPSGINARARTQASPIQLAVHIISFILSIAALVLTVIISKNNARKKKELIEQEKLTQE